jgi:beta-lactamase superfamily II metal-dependent hydrolase
MNVRGLVLTGLDGDHAHPLGVDWILNRFQPSWIMYPKYYKDTDCAAEVFAHIYRYEAKRRAQGRPFKRYSVRVDRLDSREITGLGTYFSFELFSPHIEDMDCSNNCSIVAKVTGRDASSFRYLITGDTEVERWERISALFGEKIAADVMAAPHHGALSGLYPKTILDVSPNTVLISAGVDSQFEHPNPAAVAAYGSVAKHVYATNAGAQPRCLLTRRVGVEFQTQVFAHATFEAA